MNRRSAGVAAGDTEHAGMDGYMETTRARGEMKERTEVGARRVLRE
jgi:hypothetical protein